MFKEEDQQKYELMLVLPPALGEKNQQEFIENVKKIINTEEGKIFFEDLWGLRNLAYQIKGEKSGFYLILYFELSKNRLAKVQKELEIFPNLLRFLLLKIPALYEFIPILQTEGKEQKRIEDSVKRRQQKEEEKKRPLLKTKKAPVLETVEKTTAEIEVKESSQSKMKPAITKTKVQKIEKKSEEKSEQAVGTTQIPQPQHQTVHGESPLSGEQEVEQPSEQPITVKEEQPLAPEAPSAKNKDDEILKKIDDIIADLDNL